MSKLAVCTRPRVSCITQALEPYLEATTHHEGAIDKAPIPSNGNVKVCLSPLLGRAIIDLEGAFSENDFNSLGAEIVAICNYEEPGACPNKPGACLMAFTLAYFCVLSRTLAVLALLR